jgi:Linalool dehydratase/isomerase
MKNTVDYASVYRFNKQSDDGALSKSRFRRTKSFFIVIGLIGLCPFVFNLSVGLKTAGLGLLFPGGGFVALGGWYLLAALVTFGLYKLSLVAWFGSGMIIAPVIVWGGAALVAGVVNSDANSSVWLPALPIVLGLVIWREAREISKQHKKVKEALLKRDQRKAYLPSSMAEIDNIASPEPIPGQRELTREQLGHMRYLFDLALQPVGELQGFNKIDQFQTAAYRYQINNVGYGLSTVQCHYTPNFHGYLNEAQRTLIDQALQRQVWGYWRWESLWGNLSLDFDPAGKDNIMLTGFFGLQVCLYMLASGDRRYAEPGSLEFIYSNNKSFKHDIHSIIGSIVKNQREQVFCLYPCEPNWIYTPCNFMGMKTLAAYDKLFGTTHFNDIYELFVQKLDEEFTQIDGSVMSLRSNLTGFAVPFPFADDGRALFFNPVNHQRAKEAWAMARHDMVYREGGEIKLRIPDNSIDMGIYRKGKGQAIQSVMSTAREFGDDEVAEAAQKLLEQTCGKVEENGAIRYAGSTSTSTTIARGMILRHNDWRNAVRQGPPESALQGPVLTGVSYPQVLVAKAFSDGLGLELVLYPGDAPGEQQITIERLRPDSRYTAVMTDGEISLVASGEGTVTFSVTLDDRTAITISAAEST